jgi:hypothetical protein
MFHMFSIQMSILEQANLFVIESCRLPSGLQLPQPLISGDDLAQKLDAVVLGVCEVHCNMREGLTGFNTRVESIQHKVVLLEDHIQALEYMASQQEYCNRDVDGGDGEAGKYGDDSQVDVFADE